MNHKLVEESCSDMRRQARELLRGRWQNARLISLVYYLAIGGVSWIITIVFGDPYLGIDDGLSTIYLLLVGGPLSYGFVVCLRRIAGGEHATIGDLFSGFEDFGRLFLVNLLMMIFIVLWSLLLVIPGIIAALAYSMVYFLMADQGSLRATEAIRLSKQKMKGNKGRFLLLNLSFIGWILLAFIPLLIAMLFLGGGTIYSEFSPTINIDMHAVQQYEQRWMAEQIVSQVFSIAVYVLLMPYIMMSHFVFYRHLTGEHEPSLAAPGFESHESSQNFVNTVSLESPENLANEEKPENPTEMPDLEQPENREE